MTKTIKEAIRSSIIDPSLGPHAGRAVRWAVRDRCFVGVFRLDDGIYLDRMMINDRRQPLFVATPFGEIAQPTPMELDVDLAVRLPRLQFCL